MTNKILLAIAVNYIFISLLSCGLDEFEFIGNIPQGIPNPAGTEVTVSLPSDSAEGYESPGSGGFFEEFIIFYRIYLSNAFNADTVNPNATILTSINPTLTGDYNFFDNYINVNSTMSTSQIDERFAGRNYYKLAIEGSPAIESVLSRGSLGQVLRISFSGDIPVLSLGTSPQAPVYYLQRAENGPGFRPNVIEPMPDRHFIYHSDMLTGTSQDTINNDIQPNALGSTEAYVSMYIVARGRNYIRTIFSRPAFIGIFWLN